MIEDKELARLFEAESAEHLARLDDGLLRLEKTPADQPLLEEVFRESHSLKGAARMLGLSGIETAAHGLETILNTARKGEAPLTPDAIASMTTVLGELRGLVQEALSGEPAGEQVSEAQAAVLPSTASGITSDLAAVVSQPSRMASSSIRGAGGEGTSTPATRFPTPPLSNSLPEGERVIVEAPPPIPQSPARGAPVGSPLPRSDPSAAALPIPQSTEMVGRVSPSGRNPTSNVPAYDNVGLRGEAANPTYAPEGERVIVEAPPPILQSTDSAIRNQHSAFDMFHIETVRVQTRKLDDLLTLAGELSVIDGRMQHRLPLMEELLELWTAVERSQKKDIADCGIRLAELGKKLKQVRDAVFDDSARLETAVNMLEEQVHATRLLPLSTLFALFARMVHDLAGQQGKEVELIIEGGEIGVDKRILEEMKDPLMHLLRNAIDHGIEMPAERERQGKPRGGIVRLRARRENSTVLLEVSDDGRGLDTESIRRVALKRGLITNAEQHNADFGVRNAEQHNADFGVRNAEQHNADFGLRNAEQHNADFGLRNAEQPNADFGLRNAELKTGASPQSDTSQSEAPQSAIRNPHSNMAQLQQLIFLPGFSTSTYVTELSGRGVGLDVVRVNVERLKGDIRMESAPQQGTTMQMRLPLSLATTRLLLAGVGDRLFGLPIESVHTSLRVREQDIFTLEGRPAIDLDGQPIIAPRLADLLGLADSYPLSSSPPQAGERAVAPSPSGRGVGRGQVCIVIQVGDEKLGLRVDELLGEEEVVAKPLGAPLVRVRNVSSLAILGSGEICALLNPADLVRSAHKGLRSAESGMRNHLNAEFGLLSAESIPKSEIRTPQCILLVEDSALVRAMEKRILEEAGYEVVATADGVDALAALGRRAFDAVVSDIVMPNMDGLTLTEHIRKEMRYQDLPVILVTTLSSDEDKRRGLEAGANAYLPKPSFDQRVLLETLQRLI